jgi:pantoate--beta-alanine ligase
MLDSYHPTPFLVPPSMTRPTVGKTATVVTTGVELRELLEGPRKQGDSIGFVPTMGALHEGHLSLMRRAVGECRHTVASIFVNPTQFAPGEDFERYPRPFADDLALLESAGVETVFHPAAEELYPPGFSTYVQPPVVARRWEGEYRPTHFQGVATVVLKLFQLVQPHCAFFGQKDYQQSLVVRQMVRDFHLPVDVVVCPTVRDEDGLALSSRNRNLAPSQREIALSLYRCLAWVRGQIQQGRTDGSQLMVQMRDRLMAGGLTSVDYAALCDPATLEPLETVRTPAIAILAGRVGATRLIDNLRIE